MFQYQGCKLYSLLILRGYLDYKHVHLHLHLFIYTYHCIFIIILDRRYAPSVLVFPRPFMEHLSNEYKCYTLQEPPCRRDDKLEPSLHVVNATEQNIDPRKQTEKKPRSYSQLIEMISLASGGKKRCCKGFRLVPAVLTNAGRRCPTN